MNENGWDKRRALARARDDDERGGGVGRANHEERERKLFLCRGLSLEDSPFLS